MFSVCFANLKMYMEKLTKSRKIEHSIAISLPKVIEAQSYRTQTITGSIYLINCSLFVGLLCVSNFMDIFV